MDQIGPMEVLAIGILIGYGAWLFIFIGRLRHRIMTAIGRRLRVETQAVNRRRHYKGEKARPIVPSGALRLRTHLRFELGPQARLSQKAGDYVCNYSMYVVLEFVKRRRAPIRFGFVHVPRGYDAARAVRLLAKTIDRMTQET